MNFKRGSVIFGFSPITRSRGLSRISLVARSKNVILPPIFTTSVLAVALPQFVHLVLALGLLSFLVVRPPRCAMQHGHENHGRDGGCNSADDGEIPLLHYPYCQFIGGPISCYYANLQLCRAATYDRGGVCVSNPFRRGTGYWNEVPIHPRHHRNG